MNDIAGVASFKNNSREGSTKPVLKLAILKKPVFNLKKWWFLSPKVGLYYL